MPQSPPLPLQFLDQTNTAEICWQDVSSLFLSVGWNRPFRAKADRIQLAFANSYAFCLVLIDGQLVGCGRSLSDGYIHGSIHDVAVHPNFQRKGIGTAIMKKLIAQLKGVRYLTLLTSPEAAPFYEKSDFGIGNFTVMSLRQKQK